MTTALAVIQDFNEAQTSEASRPSDALSIWMREYRIDTKKYVCVGCGGVAFDII